VSERLLLETATAGARAAASDSVIELSVVVLAWDGLPYTQRCVESIRRHTDIPYELVVVDNGSQEQARQYAAETADRALLNEVNRGFAAGMNAGLHVARGRVIAFCNNDIQVPPGWARRLVATLDAHPRAGIIVPAVTSAANPRTVRSAPTQGVEVLDPFEDPPSAVVYVMHRPCALALGGWDEQYEVASAEDLDLAFTVWVNDLDIVLDRSVLVHHVGKATALAKLPDWRALWNRNARRFLNRWCSEDLDVPRHPDCPIEVWERNLRTARAVAHWMNAYYSLREHAFPGKRVARQVLGRMETLSIARHGRRQPSSQHGGIDVEHWERAVGVARPGA
jgi:GT2 family glycosyltransferase